MALDTSPAISVVIVCWNCADHLQRCLQALEAQRDRDFEVVVIDNGSTDGAAVGLADAHPALRLRVERTDSNLGFAAASNLGALLTQSEWLVMLNPDAFPRPDWLEQLRRAAALNPGCFFASRQIQAKHPQLLDGEGDIYFTSGLALRRNYNCPLDEAGPAGEVFSACAAAAMYRRTDFLEAGAFDEDYFAYHEDVDLGFRLRLRGMRCVLVQQAVVDHVGAASTGTRIDRVKYGQGP